MRPICALCNASSFQCLYLIKNTFPEAESYNLLGLNYTKNDLDILAKHFEGLEGLTKGLSPQAVYMATLIVKTGVA